MNPDNESGWIAGLAMRPLFEGRIPGRRLSGQVRPVRFLWSEVQAVWDGERQLELGDAA